MGVQGDISSWSQAEGREGEAASLRALEGDSESPPRQQVPPATGAFGQPPAPIIKITYPEMLESIFFRLQLLAPSAKIGT